MKEKQRREKYNFGQLTAVAHSNIALVKYWGKRSAAKNLPAVGSISLTLDALKTETTFQFDASLNSDLFILNEKPASEFRRNRITEFLNCLAGTDRPFARIESKNSFPTGAGLASSASGFAALTKAVSCAAGLDQNTESLSTLARMGSGSAARSMHGGYAEMKIGDDAGGSDDYAIQLYDEGYWDIRLLVAIVSIGSKETGSTEGMIRTAETAPYYKAWIESSGTDLVDVRRALASRNFTRLGEVAEHSCMKMHGLIMSARPSMLYWEPGTVELIRTIWDLRSQGTPAYVTIDAGPQVKAICRPQDVDRVKQALESVPDVIRVIEARPGPGAYLLNK